MRLGSIRVWGSLVKQLDMEWDEWSRVRTNGHAKGRMVTQKDEWSRRRLTIPALPMPPFEFSGCVEPFSSDSTTVNFGPHGFAI